MGDKGVKGWALEGSIWLRSLLLLLLLLLLPHVGELLCGSGV